MNPETRNIQVISNFLGGVDETNNSPTHHPAASQEKRLVQLLRGCAYEMWRACLCNGPKHITELFEELSNPKVGDLVMETSTYNIASLSPVEGIGTLVEVEDAPYYETRAEAKEAGIEDDEPIPTRKVWTIKLDFDGGRVFRWENAHFIKVKSTHHQE